MAKEKNQDNSAENSADLSAMVQVRFIADSLYFTPGLNGVPQSHFYKKHQIVLVEKSLAESFKSQGLQFETYAAA